MTVEQANLDIATLPFEDQLRVVQAIWDRMPRDAGTSLANQQSAQLDRRLATFAHKLVLIAISTCWPSMANAEDADWPVYLGGKERNLYSPLDQINRENVSKLQVAWTYETGDADE